MLYCSCEISNAVSSACTIRNSQLLVKWILRAASVCTLGNVDCLISSDSFTGVFAPNPLTRETIELNLRSQQLNIQQTSHRVNTGSTGGFTQGDE